MLALEPMILELYSPPNLRNQLEFGSSRDSFLKEKRQIQSLAKDLGSRQRSDGVGGVNRGGRILDALEVKFGNEKSSPDWRSLMLARCQLSLLPF